MTKKIEMMGKFTAIGMRTKIDEPYAETALMINTCSGNGKDDRGTMTSWTWCNPTNTAIEHACGTDPNVRAVSVECLWQGTKLFKPGDQPDPKTLRGEWRRGKAKKPAGAWAGPGQPLITTPGEARVRIYIPAYRNLIEHWMEDRIVRNWLNLSLNHDGFVFLRDHDTGRGVYQRGPMSHAWLLACYLNTDKWPGLEAYFG